MNTINSTLIMSQSAWGSKQAREKLNGIKLPKTNMGSSDVLKFYVDSVILQENVELLELVNQIEKEIKNLTPCFSKTTLRSVLHTAWNKVLPEFVGSRNKQLAKDVLAGIYNGAADNCGRNLVIMDMYTRILDMYNQLGS